MRRSLLLLTAVLALAVAGCGSDSTSTSTSAPAASTDSAPAAAATAANSGTGTITVEMKNIQFSPKNISITVGQTLKWIDLDSVEHNVVADSGADFKSDVFGQDGSFEWTATKPGKIEYECTLHPGMVGTITVR
jgi:plastocyanin